MQSFTVTTNVRSILIHKALTSSPPTRCISPLKISKLKITTLKINLSLYTTIAMMKYLPPLLLFTIRAATAAEINPEANVLALGFYNTPEIDQPIALKVSGNVSTDDSF
jgi:hypothetical protein